MEVEMSIPKSLAVAAYILREATSGGNATLTPMQILKLVYIAHGYMLGKHGTPLLIEKVQAWQYGPVVVSVYQAVKGFKSAPVPRIPGATECEFTDSERSVMNQVVRIYGKAQGTTLSAATHKTGTPWEQTWALFGKNATISDDLIESFYADQILKKPKHSAL
jgi:uncharacterized phage-associated protein